MVFWAVSLPASNSKRINGNSCFLQRPLCMCMRKISGFQMMVQHTGLSQPWAELQPAPVFLPGLLNFFHCFAAIEHHGTVVWIFNTAFFA